MKRSKHTIALFSVVIIGLLLSTGAYALEYRSNPVPVSFTYSEVLSISTDGNISIANLTPGTKAISSSDYTVTVSTNGSLGYTLSATVGCASGTNCYNSKALSDGTNTFSMLESTGALTAGTWGVSLDSSATENSNFQTLPLYTSDGAIINQTTSASGTAATGYQGTNSTTVRIGAYASAAQVAGTYTNVINFSAVANPSV